jgi:PAS domain S-box-containing protein
MLEHLLSALSDCAWAYDQTEHAFIFIDPAIDKVLGVTPHDLKTDKKAWYKNIHPADRKQMVNTSLELKVDEQADLYYRVKLGNETKWLYEKKSRFIDKTTGHNVVLGVIKDVTDRHAVNYHLKNSLGDFSILFEKSINPMWIYEVPSLRILKVNAAAVEHYGYTEEQFLSFTIRDIRPKIDLAKFNEYIFRKGITRKAIPGSNRGGIWKHVNSEGEELYAEITGYEMKYNNTICRIVVATDVTDRVLYEQRGEELSGGELQR